MKRESGGHEGYGNMKREHWENKQKDEMVSDLKYAKYGMDNPKELHESVDKLSSYVKNHRMKY